MKSLPAVACRLGIRAALFEWRHKKIGRARGGQAPLVRHPLAFSGMVKERVGPGWGVASMETLVLMVSVGVLSLLAAQFHLHNQLKLYVDELLENVKIPLGGMADISEAQIDAQIDAAKQERLFGFLQMLMQPQIQVQEIERTESGKFKKN